MIRFDHVWKRYPNGREAVSDLSLSIARGEMAFLTGHSGAGKSTLLKLIALIERPSRGTLVVNGQNTSAVPRAKIVMRSPPGSAWSRGTSSACSRTTRPGMRSSLATRPILTEARGRRR